MPNNIKSGPQGENTGGRKKILERIANIPVRSRRQQKFRGGGHEHVR
jgi:hypothetical protein